LGDFIVEKDMNKPLPKKDALKEDKKGKANIEESCEKLKEGLEEQFEKVLANDLDCLEKRILGQDFS
jgi:hypothetical protein